MCPKSDRHWGVYVPGLAGSCNETHYTYISRLPLNVCVCMYVIVPVGHFNAPVIFYVALLSLKSLHHFSPLFSHNGTWEINADSE